MIQVPSIKQVFVTGSADGALRLWDLECHEPLREFGRTSGAVTCVAVHWRSRPLRKQALSGSEDGTLRLWEHAEAEAGSTGGSPLRALRFFHAHPGGVRCLAADWGSNRVLSGGEDCLLRLWDLSTGSCICKL